MPRKIWLVITPELPRAPINAPKLIAAATRSAGWPADDSAAPHRVEVKVRAAKGAKVHARRLR